MPTIELHREHTLGLAKARQLAAQWTKQVERDFDMQCATEAGKDHDVVTFTRTGVSGRLVVSGTRFDLDAKLGLLLGAFTKTIQTQIESNLDALLSGQGKASSKGKAAPTAAAKKSSKPG
jgi:putative polyhydroxyalkanoate system protein